MAEVEITSEDVLRVQVRWNPDIGYEDATDILRDCQQDIGYHNLQDVLTSIVRVLAASMDPDVADK